MPGGISPAVHRRLIFGGATDADREIEPWLWELPFPGGRRLGMLWKVDRPKGGRTPEQWAAGALLHPNAAARREAASAA